MVIGIGISLFGELFSANYFPRRGVSCRNDSRGVCRRLPSLVILDILASRPSPTLAAVDIHGVYCGVITSAQKRCAEVAGNTRPSVPATPSEGSVNIINGVITSRLRKATTEVASNTRSVTPSIRPHTPPP